jgi:protein PhnA
LDDLAELKDVRAKLQGIVKNSHVKIDTDVKSYFLNEHDNIKLKGNMENQIICPQCGSENVYHDGSLFICPECAHEFSEFSTNEIAETTTENLIKDANGVTLNDGDTITIIKDLKVKGSSSTVKVGTKVKNIRLIESDNGHNIACKIDGIGAINLRQDFVKKV